MLSRTISFGDVPAVVALLARMPWVHEDHWHTDERRFVGHILPKLEKSPVTVSWPLLASGLNPLADTLQVFQGDPCSGALRRFHETFGNRVVRVRLKPGLYARELTQLAACRPRLMPLQSMPTPIESLACVVNHRTTIDGAIRVNCEVDDAKVYTEDTLNADGIRLKDITDNRKIESALDVHQVYLALAKGQQGALTLPTLIANGQTALHSPDRKRSARAEAKNPVIVWLCCVPPKPAAGLAVELIDISNLGNAPHRHLCGQAKLCSTPFVGQFVQRKLTKRLGIPGLPSQPRTRPVRDLQRVQQRRMLVWRRDQFEVRHKFHTLKYRVFLV